MYSVTSWLGRIGFEDNPTTAIVLQLFKISAMGSAPLLAPNSDLSGTSTLIASRVRPSRRRGKGALRRVPALPIPAPAPTNISHFLLVFRWKSERPPEIPSIPAAAQSLPAATNRRL